MKFSRYNYEVSNDKAAIVFNGMTGSSMFFLKDAYDNFKKLELTDEEITAFKDIGFLVDDDLDEVENFLFTRRVSDAGRRAVNYLVYTTTNCNARCAYCYEKGTKLMNMSDMVMDKVVEYITSNLTDEALVAIQWFGGEPFCNPKVIDIITKKLKPILAKRNIAYQASVITNASLVTKELAKKAKEEWDIAWAQVTLDGTKENYERIKNYKTKVTFEQVIQNIHNFLDVGISVSIRLNYNKENMEDMKELIAYLSKEFPDKSLIDVYTYRIYDGKKDGAMDAELFKVLRQNGFRRNLDLIVSPNFSNCMARGLKDATIMPDGRLLKCCHAEALKHGIVGNVFEPTFNHHICKWCSPRLPEKCYECKYLPICNGGCIYEMFTNQDFCMTNDEFVTCVLEEMLKERLLEIEK